jgi:hypothetical protein
MGIRTQSHATDRGRSRTARWATPPGDGTVPVCAGRDELHVAWYADGTFVVPGEDGYPDTLLTCFRASAGTGLNLDWCLHTTLGPATPGGE